MARDTLRPALKRGALVAAANWPVVVIQAVADALFKSLVAMPLVGGVFLVALVVGAEPVALMELERRELTATIIAALFSRPLVLLAFLGSLAIVVVGGSLFVFLVKGGTLGVLVEGERIAGPIERPPLHYRTMMTAAAFSIEAFVDRAHTLFPRFARLGLLLMVVYVALGGAYLAVVLASRSGGWGTTALFTGLFVSAVTAVNLTYLLLQIVIAVEECSVPSALRRLAAFVRRRWLEIAEVAFVVLALVVAATAASVLVTAALGLIGFIPIIGFAVWPMQLAAWLFHAIVFQFIGLSSVGAYLRLYREVADAGSTVRVDTGVRYDAARPYGAA